MSRRKILKTICLNIYKGTRIFGPYIYLGKLEPEDLYMYIFSMGRCSDTNLPLESIITDFNLFHDIFAKLWRHL